ncbi:ATP-binding cassette domain-containing protein [Pigmentibacter ruber]
MSQTKTSLWEKLTFSDVTNIMLKLNKRSANKKDLNSIPFINETLKQKDPYPSFIQALPLLRKSPFKSLIVFEKNQFTKMFLIHITDVTASLLAALTAVQVLRSLEQTSEHFRLIDLLYQNPTLNEKLFFSMSLAIIIFLLNIFATSLHAQKIEKEMLLAWRIPYKLMFYIYTQLLNISKKDRNKFQSGDITNMAQNDTKFLGDYLSHAMVDFPVLLVSCVLVMIIMISTIGKIAWLGFIIISLQIPISIFFTWLGNKLHHEMMRRGDKRLQLVTEWIQGMRLIRYFGWGKHFKQEINQATLSEYRQDLKIAAKYCTAFAITHNWWMVVSSAIFAGIVYLDGQKNASTIFAAIWFSGILGHQITPLPWFVNAWSQALVASKRLKKMYLARTQNEEFPENLKENFSQEEKKLIDKIITKKEKMSFSISFTLENVSLKFSDSEPYVLKNINLEIPANKIIAIIGPVAAGKSILLQLLMGDLVPTEGTVRFKLQVSHDNVITELNCFVHTLTGVNILRAIQSYVPQEAFIMNSTIRENIPLQYKTENEIFTSEKEIINSLYAASFKSDLTNFSQGLETEIGEKGVNLSGGQKQRISLSRSAFKNSSLIILDDPLSAVDVKTEKELVTNIFLGEWGKNKTILWATHRLEFLKYSDSIIFLENGEICEQGIYKNLIKNKNSRLTQFLAGIENYGRN